MGLIWIQYSHMVIYYHYNTDHYSKLFGSTVHDTSQGKGGRNMVQGHGSDENWHA